MEKSSIKMNSIIEYTKFLYDMDITELSTEFIEFLIDQGYDKECSVKDKLCENCIESWLERQMKLKLIHENSPFEKYEEKINLIQNHPNIFSFGVSYRIDEETTFDVIPKNFEESIIFTPHFIKMYEDYWQYRKNIGQSKYSNFPITTFKDLKQIFQSKYKTSLIPDKFVVNEKERIEKILENTTEGILQSFEEEYNSIINSEESLYNPFSERDESMKFYLSTLTRPLAKYKVFLESENFIQKESSIREKHIESNLNQIEIKKPLLDFSTITNKVIGTIIGGLILFAITTCFTKSCNSEPIKEPQENINKKTESSQIIIDGAKTDIEKMDKKLFTKMKYTLSGNRTYNFYNDSLNITVKTITQATNPKIELAINEFNVDSTVYISNIEIGDKFDTKYFELIFMQTVYTQHGNFRDFVFNIKRKKSH